MSGRRIVVAAVAFLLALVVSFGVVWVLADGDQAADDATAADPGATAQLGPEVTVFGPISIGPDDPELDGVDPATAAQGTVVVPQGLLDATPEAAGEEGGQGVEVVDVEGGADPFVEVLDPVGAELAGLVPRGCLVLAGDPCAEPEPDPAEQCPFGVGAEVLGEAQGAVAGLPLDLAVAVGRDGDDVRCADDVAVVGPFEGDVPGDPVMLIARSSVPVHLSIEVVKVDANGIGTTVIEDLGVSSGAELEQWEAAVDADPDVVAPDHWLQRCVDVAPARAPGQTVTLTARDALGRTATWRETFPAAEPMVERSPARFAYQPDGQVVVQLDVPGEELAWSYPIDLTEGAPESCADVEARALDGERPGAAHPDPLIDLGLRDGVMRTTDGSETRIIMRYPLREGRRYDVCVFAYEPGADGGALTVTDRQSYVVATPNRLHVQVTATSVLLDESEGPVELEVEATPLDADGACADTGRSIATPVEGSGPLSPQQILCRLDGGLYPSGLVISAGTTEGTGPSGVIAIDRAPCGARCNGRPPEHFVLPLPGPEGCGDCGLVGDLVVRVDYTASDGGGADGFTVVERSDFDMAMMAPPGVPDLVGFDAVAPADATDVLEVRVTTSAEAGVNVALDAEVSHEGQRCATEVEQASTGTEHALRFEGLCAGRRYRPTVVIAPVDQPEGPAMFNAIEDLDAVSTNGYVSDVVLTWEFVGVERPDDVAAACDLAERRARVLGEDVTVGDDCYEGVASDWSTATVGQRSTFLEPGICLVTEPDGGSFRTMRVQYGEEFDLDLDLAAQLVPFCGGPARLPFTGYRVPVRLSGPQIGQGETVFDFVDNVGLRWRVRIEATDTAILAR